MCLLVWVLLHLTPHNYINGTCTVSHTPNMFGSAVLLRYATTFSWPFSAARSRGVSLWKWNKYTKATPLRKSNWHLPKVIYNYRNEFNYWNHPIVQTPPFPGKINCCNPSIQKPIFEIIIPISEHLHLAELEQVLSNAYKPLTVSAEQHLGYRAFSSILQAFSNVYYTTAVILNSF